MLGFPYGLECDFNTNIGYPIPYMKKGILSGKYEKMMVIDGINNEGFSGGPVAYREYLEEGYSDDMYIAGIIHGYISNRIGVNNCDKNEIGYTTENSGLGLIYPIEYALEIIEDIEILKAKEKYYTNKI